MPSSVASTDRTAIAGLAIAVTAISTAAILIREAEAAALTIAFWRTAGGAVVLGPVAVRSLRSSRIDRRTAGLIAASGACLALHFALWLGSLELTTVASSVTLVTMSPIFVAFGSARFLREPASGRVVGGIAVAIAGAVVIGLADLGAPASASNPLLGDLMALAGGAAVAGYLLIGRELRRTGLSNTTFAAGTYATAALCLFAVVAAAGDPVVDLDTRTWLVLVSLVLGPQLLGHAVLTWVLDRLSATMVSTATLLEPIGATVLAWIVLDELPATWFWVGAPVVLGGLVLTLRARADDSGDEALERPRP